MQNMKKQNLQTTKIKYCKWKENIAKLGLRGRLRNNTKVDEKAFLQSLKVMES